MDCEEGEEYNFAYVLPQVDSKPITLVVPTSLQMGWVESSPFFCTATETVRNVESNYCNTSVGSLTPHNFIKHVRGDIDFDVLPATMEGSQPCCYGLKVFVDNFMSLVILPLQEQLEHFATVVMTGIHDVFPTNITDGNNPISEKKLSKGEGQHSLSKTLLGIDFDGNCKIM
jgi:hypothetical protein